MRLVIAVSCLLPLIFGYASAQEAMPKDMHHDHHEHVAPASDKEVAPGTKQDKKPTDKKTAPHSGHVHGRTSDAMKHRGHVEQRHEAHTGGEMHAGHQGGHEGNEMKGFLGPY